MLGDDARGNRQAQPRAAVFCGKMRQEKFVLVLGRNAVARIRNGYLYRIGFDVQLRGHGDLPNRRVLQCFRGVVDQIDDHAAQQGRRRRAQEADPVCKFGLQSDSVEAPGKHFHGFLHGGVGVDVAASLAVGKRTNCENSLTKATAWPLHARSSCAHSRAIAISSASLGAVGSFVAAVQLAREALRRKLNGCQRVLDLMCDTPSHFLPGR